MGDIGLQSPVIKLPQACDELTLDLYAIDGSLVQADGSHRLRAGREPIAATPTGLSGDYLTYIRIVARNVSLNSTQGFEARAAFATNPTINWTGDAYLPRGTASEMPSGASVDEAGALVLRGNFTLQDFASDGERMQANIGGDPELWLDGAPVQVAQQASIVQAAAVSLVALAIGIVAKYAYGAALFTRLPADEALKHPRRQALAAYIEDNPGATFRELVREVGVPAGTCRHHLSVLQRADVIVEHRHRATVRFFENHGKYDSTWETVVMLREDDLAKVHGFIEGNPGAMQKAILQHASEQWGWSRSTTQHRLQRLVDAGVVTIREIGRRKEYSVPQQDGAWRTT